MKALIEKAAAMVLARLKEKSTWAAIFTALATYAGVHFKPEMSELITTIGMGIAATLLAVIPTSPPAEGSTSDASKPQ